MTPHEPNEFEFQFSTLRLKGRGHWPSIVAATLASIVVAVLVYAIAVDPGAIINLLPKVFRR